MLRHDILYPLTVIPLGIFNVIHTIDKSLANGQREIAVMSEK